MPVASDTLHRLWPAAAREAASRWPGSALCTVAAHGLLPTGTVLADPDQALERFWVFVFRDPGGVHALLNLPGLPNDQHWKELPPAPWVEDLAQAEPFSLAHVADSDELAQRFSGYAGLDALSGRSEDALLLHAAGDRLVARISAGEKQVVLDAREPHRALSINFEPVVHPGERV